MIGIIKKIFGSKNEREVGKIRKTLVPAVDAFSEKVKGLSDDALRAKTKAWQEELQQIEEDDRLAYRLEEIKPEAFAVVKEAARRLCKQTIVVRGQEILWDMVHFDVQLIGGDALHRRNIAEMATGEGKTLVATLPVYLNALSGRGVHVITVNDYLAARDSEWMGAVYTRLGLTVGCIQHDQSPSVRREQYSCDVTYGTNSEFGFDYLRDNGMAQNAEEQVQRGHYFAIVDEVDSILIDEARTPLIISGPALVKQDQGLYTELKPKIQDLVRQQERLCDKFLGEAKELATKAEEMNDSNLEHQIGLLLYRVQQGQPRHPGLLEAKVDTANRLRIEKAEMELHKDQTKKELYAQKEQLYFAMDEKGHDADLTEKGRNLLSPNDVDAFMMPDVVTLHHEIDADVDMSPQQRLSEKQRVQAEAEERAERIHVTAQLLKAYCMYERDTQYIVRENKVVIVDENTGRPMEGRRWSDGLHQAVEAKESVRIEEETQTYATITIQNYFRLYTKLAGMTGTAETEANEFFDIYKLGVLVIPTNRPCVRADENDSIYLTEKVKYKAVVEEVKSLHEEGRPVLVGTVAVETSELLSRLLDKARIPHSVLNAKFHQQEAEIVTRAGQPGTVTIATNMAGRGTDIKLAEGIADRGGLHVLGTERHESRRIDRQLRGRCARQGDPGSSHFFLSLEDKLMRLYGNSEKMTGLLQRVGMEEEEEISHPLLNRSIETAQKRVEQHNYQMRRRTLEYDDVMNKQREELYGFRNMIIHGDDVRDRMFDIVEEVVIDRVAGHIGAEFDEEGGADFQGLADWVNHTFPIGLDEGLLRKVAAESKEKPREGSLYDGLSMAQFAMCGCIISAVQDVYDIKVQTENPDALDNAERYTILTSVDRLWREHLFAMDGLRQSVHLRSYGQKDPLVEYKTEARDMFVELMAKIKEEVCRSIFLTASSLESVQNLLRSLPTEASHQMANALGLDPSIAGAGDMVSEVNAEVSQEEKARPVRSGPKVGRNDPCPCASGKKYKKCCGR
ncbi:MAG: preprotein translocase subunit SecA [Verrucomicrobiota bacterium]|jgi:preprotein translocase subunit SecA|nr:preprotein translocase subunit SecA [Verrucomicrobiota bacterium]